MDIIVTNVGLTEFTIKSANAEGTRERLVGGSTAISCSNGRS